MWTTAGAPDACIMLMRFVDGKFMRATAGAPVAGMLLIAQRGMHGMGADFFSSQVNRVFFI